MTSKQTKTCYTQYNIPNHNSHIEKLDKEYTNILRQSSTNDVLHTKFKRVFLLIMMFALLIYVIIKIGCLSVYFIIIDYLISKKIYWAIGLIMINLFIQFIKGIILFKKIYRDWCLNQNKI